MLPTTFLGNQKQPLRTTETIHFLGDGFPFQQERGIDHRIDRLYQIWLRWRSCSGHQSYPPLRSLTNVDPQNGPIQKERNESSDFQPSIFRCELLVSGRVIPKKKGWNNFCLSQLRSKIGIILQMFDALSFSTKSLWARPTSFFVIIIILIIVVTIISVSCLFAKMTRKMEKKTPMKLWTPKTSMYKPMSFHVLVVHLYTKTLQTLVYKKRPSQSAGSQVLVQKSSRMLDMVIFLPDIHSIIAGSSHVWKLPYPNYGLVSP